MNYERKKKMRIEIYNYAKKLIEKYGKDKAYDLATWILGILSSENYCIWQTYDKDDIELNWGKKTNCGRYGADARKPCELF